MLLPFFFLYLYLCGHCVRRVLVGFFNFTPSFGTTVLSIFFGFFTLGFWQCIALLFGTLTPLTIVSTCVLNVAMWFAFAHWVHRKIRFELSDEEVVLELPQRLLANIGVLAYVALAIFGFVLLNASRTGGVVVSPWKMIDPLYIVVFTVATLVLGWISLSQIKVKFMVFLFVVHSLLLHSYLPMTHDLFYGADGWRHAGTITALLEERPVVQAVLSETPSIGARIGIVTYGQFWALIATLVRVSGWQLYTIIAWMLPFLAAIIFPLFGYELSKLFSFSRRTTFYILWATLVPFALQAAGAFTLPVSFGFLGWLVSMLLVFHRLKAPHREQIYVLVVLGVLWLFGYSLFAVLYWFGWGVAEALMWSRIRSRRIAVIIGSVISGIVLLPLIEFLLGYTHVGSITISKGLLQIIGTFSGWFLASGPRPHDIAYGNILFNQVPSYAFVETVFTKTLWWLPVIAVFFYASAKLGTFVALRSKDNLTAWWGILTAGLMISYVITRYFLSGEQVFTRRLDAVLALCFVVTIVIFITRMEHHYSQSSWWFKFLPLFLIIDTVTIGASYSLGPDTNTVSSDQLAAMQYVWNTDKDVTKHCIIADTYPLLALEAVSGRRIIGGGFPINQYFAQPELQVEFKAVSGPNWTPTRALRATGADSCWVVAPKGSLTIITPPDRPELGEPVEQFGSVDVWNFSKNL